MDENFLNWLLGDKLVLSTLIVATIISTIVIFFAPHEPKLPKTQFANCKAYITLPINPEGDIIGNTVVHEPITFKYDNTTYYLTTEGVYKALVEPSLDTINCQPLSFYCHTGVFEPLPLNETIQIFKVYQQQTGNCFYSINPDIVNYAREMGVLK